MKLEIEKVHFRRIGTDELLPSTPAKRSRVNVEKCENPTCAVYHEYAVYSRLEDGRAEWCSDHKSLREAQLAVKHLQLRVAYAKLAADYKGDCQGRIEILKEERERELLDPSEESTHPAYDLDGIVSDIDEQIAHWEATIQLIEKQVKEALA